uniref:Endothelin-converting enzyme 1 n=1 Tax=Biomphalaria glabrata TaxID=6526 RepID=A0A2C9JGN5_BIOGL
MPGNLLAKYLPSQRQQDTFVMNGGVHHVAAHKMAPSHKGSTATNITTASSLDDPETPSDPAQVKFFPKSESRRSARNWFKRWTRTEKCLLLLCSCLFLLCIVVVIVAFTRDLHYRDQITLATSNKVCTTKSCVSTAAQIMAGMDFTADPCNDFFQYACGQWNRKHVIPEEKATYNQFDKLHDENQIIMRALLEEPIKKEEGEAVMKAKLLYKSCVNTSQIESKGKDPLLEVIQDVGGWPLLDPNWPAEKFELEHVLGKIRANYNGATNSYLFSCFVGADDKNSSVHILQLDQASLGMPSREYYYLKEHVHQKAAYARLIADIAEILGAEGPDVQKQIDDVIHLETLIANATSPSEQRHDTGALYHKMTVRELQEMIPKVEDILHRSTSLILFCNAMKHITILTVANYIVWRLIRDLIPEFSDPFVDAQSQFKLAIQGVNKNEIRWIKCVEYVNFRMGMAVGAMFIKDNFKKESKDTALAMIHDIREAFNELLEENEWMDEKTRQFAKEKANAMVERIGYPDFITDPVQLDAKFDTLVLSDDFLDNNLKILAFQSRKIFSKLRQPVDRENWEQEPVIVNAFYNPNANDIVFPAGILQPSFYSSTFPKSLNYGGIGVVIGHEITHGFDDKGRQYDKEGNIKQWWDEKTIDAFRQRAQCVIDQYSNYKLEQVNEYVQPVKKEQRISLVNVLEEKRT